MAKKPIPAAPAPKARPAVPPAAPAAAPPAAPFAASPAAGTRRKPKAAPARGKPAAPAPAAAAPKPAKPAPAPSAKGTKKAGKAQPAKAPSHKARPVLVRDSFTMPESDFALIAQLKSTALTGRRAAKKSELLRAGLQLLAALDTAALVAALDGLQAVKTGRPKKGH